MIKSFKDFLADIKGTKEKSSKKGNGLVVLKKTIDAASRGEEWRLCLQWCKYPDSEGNHGYRFLWLRNEKPQYFPLQTRLPSFEDIERLMQQAIDEGWGDKT